MTSSSRIAFLLALAGFAASAPALAQSVTIPAGVPLRVQVDHRYRVRAGTRIAGHLIAPLFSIDHQVLPVNTPVWGVITGARRAGDSGRARQILNGQFVPPTVPAISFDSLQLPDGTKLAIHTAVSARDATVVRMRAATRKPGVRTQIHEQIEARKRDALDTLHHPNVGDRIEKWVYAQLPWSPPTLWTGSQFDAELTQPLALPGQAPEPLPQAALPGTPTGILDARLTVDLDSATDKHGAPVTAVLTAPLLTPDGKQVLYPEGAQLTGLVTAVQPARWFARNGRLRFTFRSLASPGHTQAAIHGQMAASETSSAENVKITPEGTAESGSGPGKYLAPMALGVLAASSFGDDASHASNGAVVSNGFGFAARIAAMAAANAAVSRGFAFFALSKSIYFRWIARGHEVRFPKDTRLEIQLNDR